jgi:hypothetical protein
VTTVLNPFLSFPAATVAAVQSRLTILLAEEEEARDRVQELLDQETDLRMSCLLKDFCQMSLLPYYFSQCSLRGKTRIEM